MPQGRGRSLEEVTFLGCHFLIDRRIIVSNHNLDFRDRRSSRAELPTARAHARPCLGKITLLEMTRHKGTQRGASYSISSNNDFIVEIFLRRGQLVQHCFRNQETEIFCVIPFHDRDRSLALIIAFFVSVDRSHFSRRSIAEKDRSRRRSGGDATPDSPTECGRGRA